MQCKERLEAYLREHQVPFQLQHHAQAFSAQKIAESEHIPGKMVAKTIIARADDTMISLVLPASHRADLNKVQTALGAREMRLAHEAEFAAIDILACRKVNGHARSCMDTRKSNHIQAVFCVMRL